MVNVGDWRGAVNGILGRDESGPDRRDIEFFAGRLGSSRGSSRLTGPELIDRIEVLERLKAAASAEQARAQVAFAELCASGDDARAVALEGKTGRSAVKARERSTASQIALARSVSPSKGSRLLAAAKRIVGEMPHTLDALSAGRLNEDRAVWLAEGVEVLSPADRASVDVELCGDPRRLEGLGDRAVQDAVRASVDAIDDAAQLARVREAEARRRVTVRRLPDSMAQLTAILPVAQAAAVEGALRQAAAAERLAGGDRTAGQVAADTLVERVTGQAHADAVPLRVGLVMTDASLFAGARESAVLQGYGTITATQARGMVAATAVGTGSAAGVPPQGTQVPPGPGAAALAGVWLRRLYLDPSTGELAAMDSKARRFPRALADFIEIRDQRCRTPFCDAPIRHIDHVVPAVQGGETSVENGQGLCEACNHAKESPGWEQAVVGGSAADDDGTRGDIVTVAPTGHEYYSPPVRLPGAASRPRRRLSCAG
ncbi:HNH endonuclease [Sinomonas sp. P47F7]|uniref:HNH endonuclease n=1 Tax=Sinomonas sp. P47F7 TaxID=3410987 RepID=UPI003BF561E2